MPGWVERDEEGIRIFMKTILGLLLIGIGAILWWVNDALIAYIGRGELEIDRH